MDLEISKREKGNILVFDISGDIDAYTSPKLREEVFTCVRGGQSNILLNFERVSYMDSSGMGVAVSLYKEVSRNHGQFKICGLDSHLRNVFELAELHQILDLYDREEDAITAYT